MRVAARTAVGSLRLWRGWEWSGGGGDVKLAVARTAAVTSFVLMRKSSISVLSLQPKPPHAWSMMSAKKTSLGARARLTSLP